MKPALRILVVLLILPAGLSSQTPAAAPPLPEGRGLYYKTPNGLVPIEGQAAAATRVGSLLSSAATFGVKSVKMNVEIPGEHATRATDSRPVFYYRPPWVTEAVGGSAGDLVLVRMTVKHKKRQFQVGQAGSLGASAGISARSQVQVARDQIGPGLYKLTPAEPLKRGEYAFYLFRGYDLPAYVYDFSVE